MIKFPTIPLPEAKSPLASLLSGAIGGATRGIAISQEIKKNKLLAQHQELENKYYPLQQKAQIALAKAQASVLPAQAMRYYSEAQQAQAQIDKINQQMDVTRRGLKMLGGTPSIQTAQPAQQQVMPQAGQQAPTSSLGQPMAIKPEQYGQLARGVQAAGGEVQYSPQEQVQPQVSQTQQQSQQLQAEQEPQSLKQKRFFNFQAAFNPQEANKLYIQSEGKNLDAYNKEIQNIQKNVESARAVLPLLDQMEVLYKNRDLISKGNPVANYIGRSWTDLGQDLEALSKNVVMAKMGDLKGVGRISIPLLNTLIKSKPSAALKSRAFRQVVNNLRAQAMNSLDYQKMLLGSQNLYSNPAPGYGLSYGSAIPLSYAEDMYENYRDENPLIDKQGNLNYQNPQDTPINKYINYKHLWSVASGKPYSLKSKQMAQMSKQGLPTGESLIAAYQKKYPGYSREQIVRAMKRRGLQ